MKGDLKVNERIQLDVNDYLDLYLFVKKTGDTIWQEEIIVKLKNKSSKESLQHSVDIDTLWKKLREINQEIGIIYKQLQSDYSNTELQGMLLNLKQQRILLHQQIHYAKRNFF